MSPTPSLLRIGLLAVMLAGLLLPGGCRDGGPPMQEDRFRRVLTELHLARARAEFDDSLPPALRDSIFAHYEVREADFEATLRYYTAHPEDLETLYTGLVDSLNALQGRLRQGPDSSLRSTPSSGAGIDSLIQDR